MTDTTVGPNERYKIGRVISKYDLQEFHAELPDRWLGAGREAQSLRELADELNVATLRAVMTSFTPLVDVLSAEHERADRRLFLS